jgi:hypothetical protein
MAYLPNIPNYKPFYIQVAEGTAKDTQTWGMIAKSNPYPALPEPKEPFKNDWKDQDGDDEYVDEIFYKPIEFSVGFYIKTYATNSDSAVKILHQQLDGFFALVKAGQIMTYDSYTGIGFQKVRYNGYKEESFIARDNWARLICTISFKANDPITRIIYSNGSLVEE